MRHLSPKRDRQPHSSALPVQASWIFSLLSLGITRRSVRVLQCRIRSTPDEIESLYTTDLQKFISDNVGMFTSLVAVETYKNGEAKGVGEVDSLQEYFARGAATMERWVAPHAPTIDPRLMVRASFVAVLGCIMFKPWIFPSDLASDAEVTHAISEFVLKGISAAKPTGT